jgi:hypothetical protein
VTDFNQDFPFDEIRHHSGDYFDAVSDCLAHGYARNQIWSVVESENTISYGPSRHYVNLLGYVCTTEPHDDDTYYHYDMTDDIADGEGEDL